MWFCRLHTSQGQLHPRACRYMLYTEVSALDCYSDWWFLCQLDLIRSELGDRDNLNGVVPYPSSPTTPPTRPHTPATAARRLILDIAQSGVTLGRVSCCLFSVSLLSKLCLRISLTLHVTQAMIYGSGGRAGGGLGRIAEKFQQVRRWAEILQPSFRASADPHKYFDILGASCMKWIFFPSTR